MVCRCWVVGSTTCKLAEVPNNNYNQSNALLPLQIIDLYVSGHDDLADKLYEKFADKKMLLQSMIDIAAKRMNLHLLQNRSAWGQVSIGGNLIIRHIDAMVSVITLL